MDTYTKPRLTLGEIRQLIDDNKSIDRISSITEQIFGSESFEYKQIMKACVMSADTHGMGRRNDGDLLITHERAIFVIATLYLGINDADILIAIFLHDMYEDYSKKWSLRKIKRLFGADVSNLVFSVSKPHKCLYSNKDLYDEAIFARVRKGGLRSMILKTIDRFHNMITLYGCLAKMIRKIMQTKKHMFSISEECNTLVVELRQAVDEQERNIIALSND